MTESRTTQTDFIRLCDMAVQRGSKLQVSQYRGYILGFDPRTGDTLIFDGVTEEQVDVTGLGVDGAHLYIDGWVDDAR